MKMTDEGVALIKRFEGFRARSYRDAVGVWTIGYGHTSMAGEPVVRPGMVLTDVDAEAILRRDVERFANGVSRAVKVSLTDAQFSALVSFAYNVGLGNFSKSGVLAAVNRSDFADVPRRLQGWAKAGGRVLPGLVARRAAEASLFASGTVQQGPIPTLPVDAPVSKPPLHSKTLWSSGIIALLAVVQAFLTTTAKAAVVVVLLLTIAALALIVFERLKKLKQEAL
jgi:lysozyme